MADGRAEKEGQAHIILPPALIEDDIHDNAGEAVVLLNHAFELQLILLLLCSTKTR